MSSKSLFQERLFAIETSYLGPSSTGRPWTNLGLWSPGASYEEACRALAQRVGEAARLGPDLHVLDLACGYGASLAFWPEQFSLEKVSGLELQSRCVDAIRENPPPQLDAVYHGRFDQIPAAKLLAGKTFDALLCVDAAYHARSLEAFLRTAISLLKPGGTLGFSTLISSETQVSSFPVSRTLTQMAKRAAMIPAGSFLPEDRVRLVLEQEGFELLELQYLDQEVFAGFSDFAGQRQKHISALDRLRKDWLKIAITARLCRFLYRSQTANYIVIGARKINSKHP